VIYSAVAACLEPISKLAAEQFTRTAIANIDVRMTRRVQEFNERWQSGLKAQTTLENISLWD